MTSRTLEIKVCWTSVKRLIWQSLSETWFTQWQSSLVPSTAVPIPASGRLYKRRWYGLAVAVTPSDLIEAFSQYKWHSMLTWPLSDHCPAAHFPGCPFPGCPRPHLSAQGLALGYCVCLMNLLISRSGLACMLAPWYPCLLPASSPVKCHGPSFVEFSEFRFSFSLIAAVTDTWGLWE